MWANANEERSYIGTLTVQKVYDRRNSANIPEESKKYVGKISYGWRITRTAEEVRNKAARVRRNRGLRRPRLSCESDDTVVIYDITEVSHWFVKLDDSQLTGREHNVLLSQH